MPSRRSTECARAARRRSVSRFPKPASTSRRVWEVSSKVQLPELPDARMLTRRLMDSPFFNAPSASCRRLGVQPNARSKSVSSHEKMRPAASSQNGGAGVNANSTPTCANAAHIGTLGDSRGFVIRNWPWRELFRKGPKSNREDSQKKADRQIFSRPGDRVSVRSHRADRPRWRQFCAARKIRWPFAAHLPR